MSVPSLAERRLTLALFGALALIASVFVVLDARTPDTTPTASAPSASTPAGGPSASSTGPAPSGSLPGSSLPTSRATDASPTGELPGGATTSPPDEPSPDGSKAPTTDGSRGGSPQPTRSADASTPPPVAPPAPPALITGLPEPAAAVDRLVPGFPEILAPPTGAKVESSGVSNDGVRAQISLVATTDEPAGQLVKHYRGHLTEVGFDEAEERPDGPAEGATFVRGPESVVVTVSGDRFALLASVLPPQQPGKVDDDGVPDEREPVPGSDSTPAGGTGAGRSDGAVSERPVDGDASPTAAPEGTDAQDAPQDAPPQAAPLPDSR